jgi:hypothetical protein
MSTSTPVAHNGEVVSRNMDDALVEQDTAAVEQLIARVLWRAHREAEALDAPNDARAILGVAQSFADELATTNPRFDRLRFTGRPRRIRHGVESRRPFVRPQRTMRNAVTHSPPPPIYTAQGGLRQAPGRAA